METAARTPNHDDSVSGRHAVNDGGTEAVLRQWITTDEDQSLSDDAPLNVAGSTIPTSTQVTR